MIDTSQSMEGGQWQKVVALRIKDCIVLRTSERPALFFTGCYNPEGFRTFQRGDKQVWVRWYGRIQEEEKHLNRMCDALRRDGYTVAFREENSLTPQSRKGQEEQKRRRNRRFLAVKKREGARKERQRQRTRGGVHVR